MGSRYKSRNDSVIRSAFRRLPKTKDRIVEKGMKDMMENAMITALAYHDNTHWIHRSTANSYGWCVLHDGHSVAYHTNEGRHGEGNAYEQLMAVSRRLARKGWVGILLASMAGNMPMYFDLEFEAWILLDTEDHVLQNWDLFFDPDYVPESFLLM